MSNTKLDSVGLSFLGLWALLKQISQPCSSFVRSNNEDLLSAMPVSLLHRKKRGTCCDCGLWLLAFFPNLPRQNVEHLATSQPGCGVLIQLHVQKAREREGFRRSLVQCEEAVQGGN